MTIEKEQVIAFLHARPLYKSLHEDDFAQIAERMKEENHAAGHTLFSEGSQGDKFYFIFSGKVQVWMGKKGNQRQIAVLETGDFFGESALIKNKTRNATIILEKDSTLLVLPKRDFLWMLRTFPQTEVNLRAVSETYEKARKAKFDWLQENEVIYLIAYRHFFSFILSTLKPLPVIAIAALILLAAAYFNFGIEVITTAFNVLGIGSIVIGVLWIIWEWIDWRNDSFIITNNRVIWLEVDLFQSESRLEAPMTAIQSVNVETGQVGRILGFGNIFVRTFTGTGSMTLDFINNPTLFRDRLLELLERGREQSGEEQTQAIRDSIRQSLGLPVKAQPVKEETSIPDSTKKPRFHVFPIRTVDKGIITYHKHPWILFVKIWKPVLALAAVAVFLAWVNSMSFIEPGNLPVLCGFGTIGLIVLGGWTYYQFLDWSNDIYQLTKDSVIDSEKKPLGRAVTKSAPIKNILSIEHAKDGILNLLLNYGNVRINVADTTLEFFDVHNPAQVQQEIIIRMEEVRLQEEEKGAQEERTRMGEWLKAYHEVWQEEQEQEGNE